MNPMEITDLAKDLDGTLSQLADRQFIGPILATRHGEPVAIIIRHEVYAPRLDNFYTADSGDGDDMVNLVCSQCPADAAVVATWHSLDCQGLGKTLDAANRHWADNHRQ